jgi:hypothetical protein
MNQKKETLSQVTVTHSYHPSYLGMLTWGGSRFKISPGKQFERPPISKITRAKWTGGVAQTV